MNLFKHIEFLLKTYKVRVLDAFFYVYQYASKTVFLNSNNSLLRRLGIITTGVEKSFTKC